MAMFILGHAMGNIATTYTSLMGKYLATFHVQGIAAWTH